MRIRKKKWAEPELKSVSYYIQEPTQHKGHWRDLYAQKAPLWLEIGCGKGNFVAQMALENPNVNFVAVDIKIDMLGVAKRNIESMFAQANRTPDNIRLTVFNVEKALTVFDEEDKIERMFINFCNPWPKPKDKKHRLTHSRQLEIYKNFLVKGGEIWFKTDDDQLFKESQRYFDECGFTIRYITEDLHKSDFDGSSPATEHERMFTEQGIPTKFLIAVCPGKTEQEQ